MHYEKDEIFYMASDVKLLIIFLITFEVCYHWGKCAENDRATTTHREFLILVKEKMQATNKDEGDDAKEEISDKGKRHEVENGKSFVIAKVCENETNFSVASMGKV